MRPPLRVFRARYFLPGVAPSNVYRTADGAELIIAEKVKVASFAQAPA